MSRIYSNSYFHYTNKMESLLGILKDGFKGYYCEEQFKVNKEIKKLYIPMVSFCDIPLSQVSYITYGGWGIGMSSSWGNANELTPVCYFPNNAQSTLTSYISKQVRDLYDNGQKKDRLVIKCDAIIAYSKPRNKYEKGKHRANNYIERECRKAYLECSLKAEMHKKESKLLLNFRPSDISFIIVPNEEERKKMINKINKLKTIGGNKCAIKQEDKLILISKITTKQDIKKNY